MIRVRFIFVGILAVVIFGGTSWAAGPVLTIEADKTGEPISKYIYGEFIEHQGRCIYGGIWSEMLEDRKFFYPINFYFPWGEDKHKSSWKPTEFDTIVIMNSEEPYVGGHSPQIGLDGIKPHGIMQADLGLRKGREYEGYIVLAGSGSVEVQVSLVWGPDSDGRQTITIDNLTDRYTKTPFRFTAGADTDYGRLEIVGHGRGSFRIGVVSLMPADNIHGMRADTIRLLKELNATVYRWPGGNFVSSYDWRGGIGQRDKRAPRLNKAYWSEDIESNDFGLDEFMTFCRVLGAEPYMVVNAGFSDEYSAAAEVEYLNGSIDTPMGRLRADNGHPEPYNVKFWGIGNEMYQPGYMPLSSYVRKHNMFARKMREVDPSIKLIGVGGRGVETVFPNAADWTEGMLEHCADYMDLFSEHLYGGPAESIVEHARHIPDAVRGHVAAHRRFREEMESLRGKNLPLALDEWNHFWYSPQVYGEAGPRYVFKEVFGIAGGLHEMFRNSDIIYMANTHPVNVHGQIKTTKTDAAFETTGLVMKLYRQHFGSLPVAVSSEIGPLDGDAQPLNVVAAWTGDRRAITIAVSNPTTRKYEFKIDLKGARLAGKGQLWQIAHSHPMVYNEPGQPPRVVIKEKPLSRTDTLSILPLSINLYKLQAKPVKVAAAGVSR